MTANRLQIDLQALASTPGDLTLPDGSVVEVEPPELEDFLNIVRLADELEDSEDPSKVLEAFAELKKSFVEMVPDLEGVKLNIPQVKLLIESLQKLAMPDDLEELKKRKIEPQDHKKKAPTKSSKK